MLRIFEKRQLENELASTAEEATLDSESEKVKNYDLISTLALAHDAISDLRYLNRGTRGSAGRLPIEEAIAEYAYVGHTARRHDSTAYKATRLDKERSCLMADG